MAPSPYGQRPESLLTESERVKTNMKCKHCGSPIYCDNVATNSSGYYFHERKYSFGDNGWYCDSSRKNVAQPLTR